MWVYIAFSAVTQAFMEPGKYPGSSGTRNLSDNLSDLKAQVAANQKVIAGFQMEATVKQFLTNLSAFRIEKFAWSLHRQKTDILMYVSAMHTVHAET